MENITNYYSAIDLIPAPVVVLDKKSGKIIYLNAPASSLFRIDLSKESAGVSSLFHYPEILSFDKVLTLFDGLKEGDRTSVEWPVNFNGSLIWYDADIYLRSVNDSDVVVVTFSDATKKREDKLLYENMVRFRDTLYNIVEEINIVQLNELPRLINASLKIIVEFFECDMCFVHEFSSDYKYCTRIYGWNVLDVNISDRHLYSIPISRFAWSHKKVLNNEIVCINSLDELPDAAKDERDLCEQHGLKSFLLIPFLQGGKVIGHVGLNRFIKDKRWSDYEISNIKLIVRGVANMLFRYESGKRLEDQEAIYHALFNSANDSIVVFEKDIIVDCNPKALELFQCSRKDLLGKREEDLTPLTQSEGYPTAETLQRIAEFRKSRTPQVVELSVRRPNGTTFMSEISLNKSEAKGRLCTIAIFRDVSKRVKSVDELKAKENFLRSRMEHLLSPAKDIENVTLEDLFDKNQLQILQDALVDALGVSSAITDEKGVGFTKAANVNGICNLVNETERGGVLCHQTAVNLQDKLRDNPVPQSTVCLSCGFIDSVAPIIVGGKHIGNWLIGQVIPRSLDKKALIEYTSDLGLDTTQINALFEKLPKLDSEYFGRVLKLLTVLANELSVLGYNNLKLAKTIREHLELEKQLRQAKNQAIESDRLKSAFLANLSHEIRTPMNGIVGFSDLLQMEDILPEDRKEYVSLIKQSSHQLLNIINDIIDISKIESGQMDVNVSTFDINRVLKEQYAFFRKQAEKKGVQLKMVVPTGSDEMLITSDEIKLRQILTNLISNAIKFTDTGTVTFGYDVKDDNLQFSVEDTGAGIDKEGIMNVFDRFWQSKRNSPNKGGTGLGLAITKAYVELLGGGIEVSSVAGAGTKFEFVIPAFV